MSHEIQKDWKARLRTYVPFGLGQNKPKHFRSMAGVVWANRDNLTYAWKVLHRGVCDGCALGVSGLHDWTIDGVHMCLTRLNLLRLNTMPEMDHAKLADAAAMSQLDNRELRHLGRLAYPMLREGGDKGFRRITWDEALSRVANRIRASSPERIAFFVTSRGITNEVYYVTQKVARLLGTNNVDNAARLCHAPSGAAMKATIGYAATTCSYKDWYGTDLLLFFGANPANDQPVSMKFIHEAKKRGTRVVMVNPFREPGMSRYWVPSNFDSAVFGTDVADFWFPVAQGGDIAFLAGVIRIMIESGWYDQKFVTENAVGFEEMNAKLATLDWATLEKQAGLDRAAMQELAELLRDAKTAVLVWSMGITQHRFGTDAVQQVLNLGLLKGFVGRDKCGLMPIRGHSGVQGGAEMGAYSTALPGGKPVNATTAAALAQQYGFDIPNTPGLQTPQMVEAAAQGKLDVLYCLGGNFLRTLPDPDFVTTAMQRIPLRIHQDILVTDQMFIDPPAGGEVLLLPARTRYEQEDGGTETTTERRVLFSPEIPRQVGEARSEWRILLDLAKALDPARAKLLGCDSGQQIRDEIAKVVPFYDGIQNLHKTGDQFQYGGPHLCADWKFGTPDGKAHFRAVDLPTGDLKAGHFRLATRRGKQFNTLIYADVDPLTGADRDAVFINEDDAVELGFQDGSPVRVINELGHYDGHIKFTDIAPGCLQMHWPECNHLIPAHCCDLPGGVPDYNAPVRLERI